MKIETAAAPLLFAATLLTAGVLAASQANAADSRLTDVGFINAARCAGLAQGLNQDAAGQHRPQRQLRRGGQHRSLTAHPRRPPGCRGKPLRTTHLMRPVSLRMRGVFLRPRR